MRLRNLIPYIPKSLPSRWTSLLAHLAVAAVSVVSLAAQTAPQSSRELVLTVGKSLVVNSAASIERVSVGYGDIADARAVSPNEILLNGKAAGETSLIVWQQGGNKLFFDVVVRPNTTGVRTKLETLRRQLQEQLPGQDIKVAMDNDLVFLTGSAKDITSAERATAIAAAVGKVVNLLYVDVPPTDTQILLKVQFAAVDRSNSLELGLSLISTGATNTIGRMTTGQFGAPVLNNVTGQQRPTVTLTDALNFFLFRTDINLGATIKALQTRGLFEMLAEPNVLAINGKPASFLAGGEFPYPILQGGGSGLGQVTVAFREFGVRINFLPFITPRGTIRLDVAPEVSALDYTAGLTIQGYTIPGLTTRRVQTEIELESGQSFAIGGLLDRRMQETIEKIPLLSGIPLLGKLFQSKSVNKQNTELIVIVTPEIVRPIPAGQALPHLNYPLQLEPGTLPRTPGVQTTGESKALIPVEKLLESLKLQNDMKLQDTSGLGMKPTMAPVWAPVVPEKPVK